MREVRRDQLINAAILLTLLLLTSVMVVNLNRLSSPTTSKIGEAFDISKSPSNATGLLVVTVESNLTILSGSQNLDSIKIGNEGFLNEPLHGVYVTITNDQAHSGSISNLTNAAGQLAIYLPPAKYQVNFVDWRLDYSNVTVEVNAGNVTHLESFLNATGYAVQSFDIVDPYSSGWAVGWERMYVLVSGEQNVSSVGATAFVETSGSSLASILSTGNVTGLTPVSILGSVRSLYSEWVEVNVGSPTPIQSIQVLQLLSMTTEYEVAS
jgi:hypothetical protein